jgi:hypothetical protein
MNELVILAVGALAVFGLVLSAALLRMGVRIDRWPLGEEKRERSIAGPVRATRISAALFWALFVLGSCLVLQDSRLMVIGGIVTLFGSVLFLSTALVFSLAVYGTMRRRGRSSGQAPAPVPGPAPEKTPLANTVQGPLRTRITPRRPVSRSALDLLLRK